jgi:hypothetical protein
MRHRIASAAQSLFACGRPTIRTDLRQPLAKVTLRVAPTPDILGNFVGDRHSPALLAAA